MSRYTFKRLLTEAGIYRPGVAREAVATLGSLVENPHPLQPTRINGDPLGSPSALPHMGPLIRTGFAKLDQSTKCYIPTDEGRDWFSKVSQIINTAKTPA